MSAVLPLPLPVKALTDGRKRRSLVAAAVSRSNSILSSHNSAPSSLIDLVERATDAVAVFEPQLCDDFQKSAQELMELMPCDELAVIILVARRPPPVPQFRPDGPVLSFMCTPAVLKQILAERPNMDPRDLCFELLHRILNGSIHVGRLLVRQIPLEPAGRDAFTSKLPVALIMAHRGDPGYLDTALHYLSRTQGNRRVRVGLDVESPEDYRSLMQHYPDMEFFHAAPAPVGPYVIRQELAGRSSEPLLALQDSDDLSCYDRFTALSAEIAATGCDMIGSHELRVDEIGQHVVAVRFPLDATAALTRQNVFALLHATLMIKREAFFSAGGLSTDQVVANDTQFLMRAFFHCRIRNVDEFLYIRRRHGRALTMAPETAAGNDLRSRLDHQWTEDFEAVKRGELALEESSLRPMQSASAYRVERITLEQLQQRRIPIENNAK